MEITPFIKLLETEQISTLQKVELVAPVVGDRSLSSVLVALALLASTWYYCQREKVDYKDRFAN